jgi:hypothetical protein
MTRLAEALVPDLERVEWAGRVFTARLNPPAMDADPTGEVIVVAGRAAVYLLATDQQAIADELAAAMTAPVVVNRRYPETAWRDAYDVLNARDRDVEMVDMRVGRVRWQVFTDDEYALAGFIEGHDCPLSEGSGGLFVFDGNGRALFAAKKADYLYDDGCLSSYRNCLHAIGRWLDQPLGNDVLCTLCHPEPCTTPGHDVVADAQRDEGR